MAEHKSGKRIVLRGQSPSSAFPRTETANSSSSLPYIYLLSPANATGRRARMLFSTEARFELAYRLRTTGITLGEAYSFMSSLYFRGKLTYASTFSNPAAGLPGTLVITPSRGLLRPDTVVNLADLSEITAERIVAHNPRYRDPLERDLRILSEAIGQRFCVVLLGSITTRKYLPLLQEILGDRLLVPRAFIGLGNMSRGALLLQSARDKSELEYVTIAHATPNRF